MLKVLSCVLLLGWASAQAYAADSTRRAATAADKARDEKANTAFMLEQRPSEIPFRMERDCPAPESIDVTKGFRWNSMEIGLSFPLGETGGSDWKPYTRYTCPGPRAP